MRSIKPKPQKTGETEQKAPVKISYKLMSKIEAATCPRCITSRTCHMRTNFFDNSRKRFTECSTIQNVMEYIYHKEVEQDLAEQAKIAAEQTTDVKATFPSPVQLAEMLNVGLNVAAVAASPAPEEKKNEVSVQ